MALRLNQTLSRYTHAECGSAFRNRDFRLKCFCDHYEHFTYLLRRVLSPQWTRHFSLGIARFVFFTDEAFDLDKFALAIGHLNPALRACRSKPNHEKLSPYIRRWRFRAPGGFRTFLRLDKSSRRLQVKFYRTQLPCDCGGRSGFHSARLFDNRLCQRWVEGGLKRGHPVIGVEGCCRTRKGEPGNGTDSAYCQWRNAWSSRV